MTTIWYNPYGKIFFSKESAPQEESLSSIELESLPDFFPVKYCGRRYIDNLTQRIIEDVEVEYEYVVDTINKTLKKITWIERYYSGEFTLADFQQKILKKLKTDYSLVTRESDFIFLLYIKRKALELLEEGDLEKFTLYMERYKTLTLNYRTARDEVKKATTIEELYNSWQIQYKTLDSAYEKLSGIEVDANQFDLNNEELLKLKSTYDSLLIPGIDGIALTSIFNDLAT